MTKSDFRGIKPTRFATKECALYIWRQSTGLWRYVVCQDGSFATVGPQFRNSLEAYAFLPTYARDWGFQ